MADQYSQPPAASSQPDTDTSQQLLAAADTDSAQTSEYLQPFLSDADFVSVFGFGGPIIDFDDLSQPVSAEPLQLQTQPQPEIQAPPEIQITPETPPTQTLMPPPSRPAPISPNINLAMSISGGFQKDSPLHNWIIGSEKVYPNDPTQTTLINAMCKILSDPTANDSFNWASLPNDQSFVRIDLSIWIGERRAPGCWRGLNVRPGWRREARHVLEHIGDPRLCRPCSRDKEIEGMRRRIGELEAAGVGAEKGRGVKRGREEDDDGEEEERPVRRARKEPATRGRGRGRGAAVRGLVPASGRGSRGGRGGRARRAVADPHQAAMLAFSAAEQQALLGFAAQETPMMSSYPPVEQQPLPGYPAPEQQPLSGYPAPEQQPLTGYPTLEQQALSNYLLSEQNLTEIPGTQQYPHEIIDPQDDSYLDGIR